MGPFVVAAACVVATTTKDDLLAELRRHTGEFTVRGDVDRPGAAELDARQFDLLLGERTGEAGGVGGAGGSTAQAYLVDPSMVLAHDPDLLIAMSARLGTVIGGGAEPGSESYWLTAARDGKPLRYVYWSAARMTKGISMGEPLPTERAHPIVERDGRGVLAAMALFELDPSEWLVSGPGTIMRYDFSRPAVDGPIAKMRSQHVERYKRPDDGT
jgi:hypothetical protein